MNRFLLFGLYIIIALGVGLVSGFLFTPGDWYQTLNKPFFNPPNWIFGPVWTALYILIGIAGAHVWRWDPQSGAVKAWWVQMVLNACWSAAFFGLQNPMLALVIIVLLWLTITFFMGRTRQEVPVASWLFVPYWLWVSFAALLNAAIVSMN